LIIKLYRVLNYLKLKSANDQSSFADSKCEAQTISKSLEQVKRDLEEVFIDCNDFILREVLLGRDNPTKIVIAFMDGLVDKQIVNLAILKPIMIEAAKVYAKSGIKCTDLIHLLKEELVSTNELADVTDFTDAVAAILSGETVIFVAGSHTALKAGTRGWDMRAVEEPDTESVVRGPREGFVETMQTNMSLIRRKVKNPKLKFERMKLGTQTNTDICICYIKGIAHEGIVDTVKKRLNEIKIDAILESGYIEEFIEDAPFSIFPTVGNTEKPDVAAAKLLEGRVLIICDGTPFSLTVPYLFIEALQASEDYYSRFYFSSFVRILRAMSLVITTTLPAAYVALISFHQDVIPFKLLLSIAASREGIPFSAFTEALFMGITFELLREAGVRMPRPIGQAVSIVGALVLGESAVSAGLASNIMVIVTALTAICSFISPPLGGTIVFLRLISLVTANILGFLGLMLTITAFIVHLCSIRSFGVPYMSPLSPLSGMDLKDTAIRYPMWAMFTRPQSISRKNLDRMNIN